MKKQIDATNAELRVIMADYGLTRKQAARLCMASESAVDRWLLAPLNSGYRRMSPHRLKLLVLEIANKRLRKLT